MPKKSNDQTNIDDYRSAIITYYIITKLPKNHHSKFMIKRQLFNVQI